MSQRTTLITCGDRHMGRAIQSKFETIGINVIYASFNVLGLRNFVNYGTHVLPCPGASKAIADGDRIAVNWENGQARNLEQGTEITGKPLPAILIEIAEKGGVIPVLQAEVLLEDAV